jgi:hypothetical protein
MNQNEVCIPPISSASAFSKFTGAIPGESFELFYV